MSSITEFFIDDGWDHQGRTLEEMLKWPDSSLEAVHDFIQWAFPLHEKSYHSLVSPVLTEEDIQILQSSPEARQNMLKAYLRICKFLGLGLHEDEDRQKWWCHKGNHNNLRITRIIRSLRLFGLEDTAKDFCGYLEELDDKFVIDDNTWKYWERAMNEDVMESMSRKFLDDRRIDL
jgi:hypothetical protein